MPSILGFSLGGYAIWLAIGDDRFRAIIAGSDDEDGDEDSPFMEVNATFVHFIGLQFLSIIAALICKALAPESDTVPGIGWTAASAAGFFIFLYALLSALAAAMAIFRVASWYDQHHTERRQQERENTTGAANDD